MGSLSLCAGCGGVDLVSPEFFSGSIITGDILSKSAPVLYLGRKQSIVVDFASQFRWFWDLLGEK